VRLPTAGDVTAYGQLRCYFTIRQPLALQLLGKCDGIRPRLLIGFPAATLSRLRPLPLPRVPELDRVLDPVFQQLSQADEIFDEETLDIASKIQIVDDAVSNAGVPITQGATAVKHSWTRGALAAIGQYVLRQGREITKAARDAVVKEGVSQAIKHSDQLVASMLNFLQQSKPLLLSLADALQSQFGWIISLLAHLGL
jgi:fructose-specific phosphotransferase system component IIB